MTAGDVLAGQVAVVTGGGHGIGAAIAAAVGAAGARVAVLDVDGPAARTSAEPLGDAAVGFAVDVTDEQAVRDGLARVADRFGGLDLLVNNAAITAQQRPGWFGTPVLDHPVERWRRVLDVNLTGAFICAQQAARAMAATGGSIVNIASIQGVRPTSGSIDYATSKAGLIMLTRCLAGELAAYKIRVNAVAPGPIATGEEPGPSGTLTGLWGTPRDVADAVVWLASPAARYVNGHVLMVDDGASVTLRQPPARTGDDA